MEMVFNPTHGLVLEIKVIILVVLYIKIQMMVDILEMQQLSIFYQKKLHLINHKI